MSDKLVKAPSTASKMVEAAGRDALSVVKTRRRVSLGEWIQEARAEEGDRGEKCIAFALTHMKGTSPTEVHVIRLGGKDWTSTALGEVFQRKAETYAQDLPGMQTFNLLAFYVPDEKSGDKLTFGISENAPATAMQPGAHHIFTVGGRLADGETGYGGLMTEAPTAGGTLQMAMRLTNDMYQRNSAQQGLIFAQQTQLIQELHREAMDAKAEARDGFVLVKEMIMQQLQMQHDSEMKALEFKRSSEERKLWIAFGPPLLNTIAGREIFPQNMADTQILDGLAEIVDEDTIKELGMKVGAKYPDKVGVIMGPLMERFTIAMKKKALAQEQQGAVVKRLSLSADPEADAAGGVSPAQLTEGEKK